VPLPQVTVRRFGPHPDIGSSDKAARNDSEVIDTLKPRMEYCAQPERRTKRPPVAASPPVLSREKWKIGRKRRGSLDGRDHRRCKHSLFVS